MNNQNRPSWKDTDLWHRSRALWAAKLVAVPIRVEFISNASPYEADVSFILAGDTPTEKIEAANYLCFAAASAYVALVNDNSRYHRCKANIVDWNADAAFVDVFPSYDPIDQMTDAALDKQYADDTEFAAYLERYNEDPAAAMAAMRKDKLRNAISAKRIS